MKREEQNAQISVMQFLDAALIPPAFAFHVPNGGARSKVEAGILKAMGVKAGVPDVFVIAPGNTVVAIEMKAVRGRARKDQERRMEDLRACGIPTAVCRTLGEVVEACQAAGIRLRARLAA